MNNLIIKPKVEMPQTDNFEMVILNTTLRADQSSHYGVLNRYTNKIEHNDAFMSKAYFAMQSMQKHWDKMMKDWKPTVKEVK